MAVSLSALLLAGCSTPVAEPTVSLTDSKAATQLLRLDTSSRIPSDYVSEIVRPSDVAEPCEGGDPRLRWVSSASARLTSEHADDVLAVHRDLVDSFVERGWNKDVISASEVVLTSDSSIATVTISAHEETTPRSVDILAVGPCVVTDGLESSEVQLLLGS